MAKWLEHPWVAALIPLARAGVRYGPPSRARDWLWQDVVEPYLAWRDHRFVARTSAGRIAGTTNDIIQQYLYYFGTWEPQVTNFIQRRLSKGDGFVDVGGNIGYFALLAERSVGSTGPVIAVEASPANFTLLCANLRRNRSRVRAVHCAAADQPGRLKLYAGDEGNCGTASVVEARGTKLQAEVEAAPLDTLISPAEQARARLVKVDVEGAEAAVVKGMTGLLAHGRKDCEFIVELHPQQLALLGQNADDVLRPFHDAGFNAYQIENDYDAAAYLRPVPPRKLPRLPSGVDLDMNLVFSRADAAEI